MLSNSILPALLSATQIVHFKQVLSQIVISIGKSNQFVCLLSLLSRRHCQYLRHGVFVEICSLSLSLTLYIYIYIYIYTFRSIYLPLDVCPLFADILTWAAYRLKVYHIGYQYCSIILMTSTTPRITELRLLIFSDYNYVIISLHYCAYAYFFA